MLAQARQGSNRRQAFGLALGVEALILFLAATLLVWSAPPRAPEAIAIELAQLAPEPPKPQPKKLEPPKPKVHQPSPRPQPTLTPPPQAQVMPQAPATPFSEPAPPPPPPVPASAAKEDPAVAYGARVRAAVQSAVLYPPAAISMNYTGRARVEFNLRDGHPGQARIIHSSNLGMIDRAALRAVQEAVYPPPPAGLQGKDLSYQVWVEFLRN